MANIENLQGPVREAAMRIIAECGPSGVTSGFRTRQEQEVLWAKYQNGTGNLAARPGTSQHEHGNAIDIDYDGCPRSVEIARAAGLVASVPGEPWHYSIGENHQVSDDWYAQQGMQFDLPAENPQDVLANRLNTVMSIVGVDPLTDMPFINPTEQPIMGTDVEITDMGPTQQDFFEAGPAAAQGSGVERWRETVLQALAMTGQDPKWADAILARIAFESGGDPNAVNRWDSNAKRGDPSMGLMQNIPSAYASRVSAFPALRGTSPTHPLGSIVAGITYTLDRYGSLSIHSNPSRGY